MDSSKINILLIEFSERNVRYLLEESGYGDNIVKAQTYNKEISTNNDIVSGSDIKAPVLKAEKMTPQNIKSQVFEFIFNKKINTNIESNIWDITLFTPIKELKADINYKLFNSVDDNTNVAVSEDGKQLLYEPTIDTSSNMSSFKYLSDSETDTLIDKLNAMYSEGKKMGFKKIYLTIIPNPVSILEPNYNGLGYNELLHRVESSAKLQIPYIDLEPVFNQLKGAVYLNSDSHWNFKGGYIWLSKFNAELENTIKESETAGSPHQ